MSSMSEISQVGLKSVLIIDRLFGRSFPRVAGGGWPYHLGMLSSYVESYKVPVERMVRSTIPSGAGKKDNERKSIRKRKKNPPRDVSQYGERIDAEASTESDSPCEVVFIAQTKATTSYGCKGRVRDKASDPPPPAPHDIFLRHKECRVYQ